MIKKILNKNKGFLCGIFILLAMRWSFADQYRVPTGSMEPTIHVGDHIGTNKMAYDLKIPFTEKSLIKTGDPQRGDIVVFIWPGDEKTVFVKRLIGLPGDHLQISDGFVTINGQQILGSDIGHTQLADSHAPFFYKEEMTNHQYSVRRVPGFNRGETIDLIVPQDSYFFMGDNRDDSNDSRYWGFVRREALKGRALRTLWNITFENYLPEFDFERVLHSLD